MLSLARRLDQFLEHIDCGDTVVYGDLEAYSCEQKAGRIFELLYVGLLIVPYGIPQASLPV
jgi:hypothetical protein